MSKPLENKLALDTGSSRGIGAAIAVRLAAEGAHVIVNYAASPARAEQVVSEITKAGGHAEAVQADLSTEEGTKALAASVDKVFGGKFGGDSAISRQLKREARITSERPCRTHNLRS